MAIPIVDEESHPRRTRYHNNVATVCTTPLTLKTDCMKCVARRSVVKELVDSYKKLKSKHCKSKDKLQSNHHLMQALKRKTCIERSLRSKLKEQKKENCKKDARISRLFKENTQLQHCNCLSKINKLNKSNLYLRLCNREDF